MGVAPLTPVSVAVVVGGGVGAGGVAAGGVGEPIENWPPAKAVAFAAAVAVGLLSATGADGVTYLVFAINLG